MLGLANPRHGFPKITFRVFGLYRDNAGAKHRPRTTRGWRDSLLHSRFSRLRRMTSGIGEHDFCFGEFFRPYSPTAIADLNRFAVRPVRRPCAAYEAINLRRAARSLGGDFFMGRGGFSRWSCPYFRSDRSCGAAETVSGAAACVTSELVDLSHS